MKCMYGTSSPPPGSIAPSYNTIIYRELHRTYVGAEDKIPPREGGVRIGAIGTQTWVTIGTLIIASFHVMSIDIKVFLIF